VFAFVGTMWARVVPTPESGIGSGVSRLALRAGSLLASWPFLWRQALRVCGSDSSSVCDLDIAHGILDAMARTVIDIDEEQLAAAARELGTKTKVDTVNAALAFVAERRRRAEVFDDPLVWGSPDLADPDIRAAARR